VDPTARKRLEAFLLPLYQDLDGVSRFSDVERIGSIARRLYPSSDDAFELLILFRGLGKWLEKVGNVSRTSLAVGVGEAELRRTAASIRRLDAPQSDAERAVAGAILIDQAGVRGLSQKFASARREGHSLLDVVREELASAWIPEWMPDEGRAWLETRFEARRRVCREILDELALEDYVVRSTPARS
jgi:hypothetical protein